MRKMIRVRVRVRARLGLGSGHLPLLEQVRGQPTQRRRLAHLFRVRVRVRVRVRASLAHLLSGAD